MNEGITKTYGGKIRVRICGLCWEDDRLLMVNHKGLTNGDFWAPPGGGLSFGESAKHCLQKEFFEETGLSISSPKFLFGCEFIRDPLHAIELFFRVSVSGGVLKNGYDPELQIIQEVKFMSPSDLLEIHTQELHGIFNLVKTSGDLNTLTGFFTI